MMVGIVHCTIPSFIIHYSLFIIHYSLFIIHFLLKKGWCFDDKVKQPRFSMGTGNDS